MLGKIVDTGHRIGERRGDAYFKFMQVCCECDTHDEEILEYCNSDKVKPAFHEKDKGPKWDKVHRAKNHDCEAPPCVCNDNPDRIHILVSRSDMMYKV